jgi:opacity protein-like surface antigen
MSKKLVLLCAQLLVVATIHAQVRYFIQTDGNLSIIPKTKNSGTFEDEFAPYPNSTKIESTTKFENQFGFNVKGGVQFKLADKLRVESSLSFSYLNYRQKNHYKSVTVNGGQMYAEEHTYYGVGYSIPNYSAGLPVMWSGTIIPDPNIDGDPDKQGVAHLGYGNLGATLKYNFLPKTSVGLGASMYALLLATTYKAEYTSELVSPPNGNAYKITTHIRKEKSKGDFKTFGASCNLNIEQQLTPRISVEGSLTQHLTKLYKEQSPELDGKKPKMRYISLGVRYYLK